MIFGSVCSGIEAASVAWHPLGWRAAFYSEIEKFPRAVLSHHYPDVPLHGDFTTIEAGMYDAIDLLAGGTPCQSFSIAGLRKGLTDDRGNLSLEFIRLAARLGPRWLVWENVPGVLSSNGGRDFAAFLGGLAECGYGFAYRVLDAQYFGVPQRRRRVVLVGYLGNWRPAAAVLFEREGLLRDITPCRKAGKAVAITATPSVGSGKSTIGTLMANAGTKLWLGNQEALSGDYHILHPTAHTLRGEGHDASEDGTGRGVPLVPTMAFPWQSALDPIGVPENLSGTLVKNQTMAVAHTFKMRGGCDGGGKGYLGQDDAAFTVSTGQDQHLFHGMCVRRLTPRECERLQGFPDDYTSIPTWNGWRKMGADETPELCIAQGMEVRQNKKTGRWRVKDVDGPRYKALGNSWAVPKFCWLGERIQMVEELT